MLINLAITRHWIDSNFRLHQELLAFTSLEGRHMGEYMASVVFDTLDEFDIKEKFFCVTSDSGFNNLKMVKDLLALLHERSKIKWDWKTNHIPCLAHSINLVVQKFIKTLAIKADDDFEGSDGIVSDNDEADETIMEDSDTFDTEPFVTMISKICAVAKSIRGTSLQWERFEHACKAYDILGMTIPLDITVRWNSTFRMLLKAIYLREPIQRYVEELKVKTMRLTDVEWE